nr:far upstream element-binding protein [Tanacetum cinerariifolium]
MDQQQKIEKYAKAKIEDPNPQFPKSLLKPGSDPTSSLNYTEIYEEDNRRAQHLREEITAGAQLCRKVYRIRSIDLVKVLDEDFKGMLPIHRASKATIGLLSDAEAIKHKHSYIDLVGTVEQVKMAEELILDKVLKAYSRDCYPVILMPPTVHEYEMKITFDKVSSIIGLFRANILRLEMTSGAWITLSPPPPAGVIEHERVANIYGPPENVIKAVSLIRSAMSQPMESLEGGSDFKEPSCGELSGSGVNKGSKQLEESTSGKGQMEGGSSTERDRKGKAKVEESDHIPAPTPEIRSFIDNDHHYLRIIGQLPVGPNSIEGVTRELLRIRVKDVHKILGNQDLMLRSIHSASGATVGIFTDATARFHFHAYLELLGTADQIRIAELLITDAITEIPLDDVSSVPTAIMPLDICHKSMNIPSLKVVPLLGIDGTNLTRIEAESGTWIELDTYVPPMDAEACESTVNIYGSKQQVKNAMEMINAIVSEGPVLLANEEDFGIEEIGYNEQGEKQDFAAWEDELETYYENHGWENIREVDFGKDGSGGDTAHKDTDVTTNEEVEGKKSVKEGEQKDRVASGSGTQKNDEESEEKKNTYLELLGTADLIKIAELLITDAITEIPLDDVSSSDVKCTTPSWDRTNSYLSDGDTVHEDRLDPPANEEDFGIEEIGYNEQGEKQDFAAWEDELETYYENHGWENIREMDFGKDGSGGDTAHKDSAVTTNEEVEGKKSVKEGEQKDCVASGSGTQKNDEESEEKKSVNGEEQKECVESVSGTQKNVEGSEDKKSVKEDEQKERAESGSGTQKNVEEPEDKKSVKKSRKKKKKKSVKEDEQKDFAEKDGSGGETAHTNSAVTKIPLDDVSSSVPTAIMPLDICHVKCTTPSWDRTNSYLSDGDTVHEDRLDPPGLIADRTNSYLSDGDTVHEDRLDPPGLIALKGCSSSEAYQLLNYR